MTTKIEKQLLNIALQGNKDAIDFMESIIYITQVWDDLIDKDKSVTSEMINKTFHIALIQVPQNRFFQQYVGYLLPVMNVAINDWLDANVYESSDKEEKKRVAYVLRESVSNVLVTCTYIIGGYDWMRKMSLDIRNYIFDEDYDHYLKKVEG